MLSTSAPALRPTFTSAASGKFQGHIMSVGVLLCFSPVLASLGAFLGPAELVTTQACAF